MTLLFCLLTKVSDVAFKVDLKFNLWLESFLPLSKD